MGRGHRRPAVNGERQARAAGDRCKCSCPIAFVGWLGSKCEGEGVYGRLKPNLRSHTPTFRYFKELANTGRFSVMRVIGWSRVIVAAAVALVLLAGTAQAQTIVGQMTLTPPPL